MKIYYIVTLPNNEYFEHKNESDDVRKLYYTITHGGALIIKNNGFDCVYAPGAWLYLDSVEDTE